MCFIGVNLARRSSEGRSEIEREERPGSGFSGVEEERRSAEIRGGETAATNISKPGEP